MKMYVHDGLINGLDLVMVGHFGANISGRVQHA